MEETTKYTKQQNIRNNNIRKNDRIKCKLAIVKRKVPYWKTTRTSQGGRQPLSLCLPREESASIPLRCGLNPTCWWRMNDEYWLGWFSTYWRSAQSDVCQRPKTFFSRTHCLHTFLCVYINPNPNPIVRDILTLLLFPPTDGTQKEAVPGL
jgi:hypothetical protein